MQVQTDKIPKHHGEFYFEPTFSRWKEDVLKNREALSKASFWGQSPLKVRAALKLPTDQPIILSGHQPVFVHPGIWAKCLAASALAESVGGIAYHKLTDTALAPEFTHYMPELEADGRAHKRELDFFSSVDMKKQEKSVPYAFMPAPEKPALEKVFAAAENYAPPSVKKAVKFFSEKLLKGLKVNVTWDLFQTYALGLLDEICGTKRMVLEGSALWRSDPFIEFLVYWFKHMNEVNEHYNQSLNEYRRINNITHDIEPVANLKFENWYFEVPFWGTTAHHHRDTVWAKVDGKHLLLKVGTAEGKYSFDLAELKLELSKSTLMIWPKALPQTLFCRMYLCDYFIHGTGGAVYEEVGNMFFEKAFKAAPPAFGVVSSTYLADAQDSQNLDVIMDHEKNLEWWVRALEKNPEYVFTRQEDWQKELPGFIHPFFKECLNDQELGKVAREKVKQIELLQDPVQRTIASLKIKGLNSGLKDGCIKVLAALDQGLLDLKKIRETRDVLAFREYPFFCFEPEVFLDMKEKIKKAAPGLKNDMEHPLLQVEVLPGCEDLGLPAYATEHAAGLDLRAALTEPLTLQPGERGVVPTGLKMEIPIGFEGCVRPRSGLAMKQGLTLTNAPGTIDSDYRGEVKVLVINLGQEPVVLKRGDRIAQLLISPVAHAKVVAVAKVDETVRGVGGFGHTGVQ